MVIIVLVSERISPSYANFPSLMKNQLHFICPIQVSLFRKVLAHNLETKMIVIK